MEGLANGNLQKLPKANLSVRDLKCNLSGLENLALKLYRDTGDRSLVCAFVFDYVARVLGKLTEQFREKYPGLPVLYAGGVMSNRIIQSQLAKYEKTCFAEPQYSADNAAGIALLCRRKYLTENICNEQREKHSDGIPSEYLRQAAPR